MTPPRTRPRHAWSESHAPATLPLVLHLHQARETTFARIRPLLARHALTPAQFDVLATLRNAPPPYRLTPSRLRACLLITSGGLTKVMRQLEARDLVLRSQDVHDQRVKPIQLTHAGRALIEDAMTEASSVADGWLRGILSETEIATLNTLLQRLVDAPDSAPG